MSRAERLLREFRQRAQTPRATQTNAIARTSWATAGPVVALADPMLPAQRITIHHDGMTPFTSTSQRDAMRRLEQIRQAHRRRGWADIGYHFAVDPAGRVYQCRPMNLQGAHVKHNNERNIGVLVIGNYMDHRPSAGSLQGVVNLVAQLRSHHRLGRGTVFTHQEIGATACPGRLLQPKLVAMRTAGGPLA
mgnify:CR=1 FL=1